MSDPIETLDHHGIVDVIRGKLEASGVSETDLLDYLTMRGTVPQGTRTIPMAAALRPTAMRALIRSWKSTLPDIARINH